MGWFIAQSLVFILVAFAIGLLVGWLIWGRRKDKSTSRKAEKSSGTAQPEAVAADEAPEAAAKVAGPEDEPEATSSATDVTEPVAAEASGDEGESVSATEGAVASATAAGSATESESASVSESASGATSETGQAAETTAPEATTGTALAAAPQTATETADADGAAPSDGGPATGSEQAALAGAAGAAAVAGAGSEQKDAEAAVQTEAAAEPQDLQRIEGIGPKIEATLKAQGYTTYASIAGATEDELRAALKEGGVRFAPAAGSWAEQAKYLVDGDEDGLKEFQDYLIGGQDRRGVKFNEKVDFTDVDEITDEKAKADALAADAAEVAKAEANESGAKA